MSNETETTKSETLETSSAIDAALQAAYGEVPPVLTDCSATGADGKTIHYASFQALIAALRPILTEHNLMCRFVTETARGFVTQKLLVCHADSSSLEFGPVSCSANLSNPLEVAASADMLRRILLTDAFGICEVAEPKKGLFAKFKLAA